MDPYNSADAFADARPPAANPYAAPIARVTEVRGQDLNRASRMSRLGAVILDGLLFAGPAVLAAVIIPAMRSPQRGMSGGQAFVLGLIGLWCVGFAIYQFVQLHRTGQTLGKKIVGVRIVRTDGSRASLGRIFLLRYMVPGLSARSRSWAASSAWPIRF